MSRKKMRGLEERCDSLVRECADQRDMIISLRVEIDRVSRGKDLAEKTLVTAVKELENYKVLYADEVQKRLELAEIARKLEDENRRLRGELSEVLGE